MVGAVVAVVGAVGAVVAVGWTAGRLRKSKASWVGAVVATGCWAAGLFLKSKASVGAVAATVAAEVVVTVRRQLSSFSNVLVYLALSALSFSILA